MNAPDLEYILSVMRKKNYAVFEDRAGKGYDLNIVGIRSANEMPNRFDDLLTVFYRDGSRWQQHTFPATTDPGLYWLTARWGGLMGTAILKEGQYRSAYQIGYHKGQYEALVQRRPVTVLRDYDRDGRHTFNTDREETGLFGINIHRAHAERSLMSVDAWSAGCQVVQNPRHFDELMTLAKKASETYGNAFSYTLLHENDFS